MLRKCEENDNALGKNCEDPMDACENRREIKKNHNDEVTHPYATVWPRGTEIVQKGPK